MQNSETIRAVEIARRHMREAEAARDASLSFGDTRVALIQARQAQIADAIAREIEGIANELPSRLAVGPERLETQHAPPDPKP